MLWLTYVVRPSPAYGGKTGVGLLADGTLDGAVAEHFGGFEWANRVTGAVDLDVVRQWIDIFAAATKLNKTVLVRTPQKSLDIVFFVLFFGGANSTAYRSSTLPHTRRVV